MSEEKRFQQLMVNAVTAAQNSRWRESGDYYKAMVTFDTQNPRILNVKYYQLSGYCSILVENQTTPTAEDFRFLKEMGNNAAYPAVYRVRALFTKGFCKWYNNADREGAARSYRKAIYIGESATASEKSLLHMAILPSGELPASTIIAEWANASKDNLSILMGTKTTPFTPTARAISKKF